MARAARKRRPAARAGPAAYELVLYIGGASEHSQNALANIKVLAEKHLKGRYRLEVVDLYQQPDLVRELGILAVPTLVKKLPSPLRRMAGDLSDEDLVLVGLDLARAAAP